jgi:glycosyltransferase 2 family protein
VNLSSITGRPRKLHWLHFLVASLLLLLVGWLAARFLLPQVSAIKDSWQVLQSMTWGLVALAVVAQSLCYVSHGVVIRDLQRVFGQSLSLLRGIAIVMASYSLSMLWGGQVTNTGTTYRWLRATGEPSEAALITGMILPLLNTLSFSVISGFGLVYLLAAGKLTTVLAIVFGGAFILLVSVAFSTWWLMRHRDVLLGVLDYLARQWARFRRKTYQPRETRESTRRLSDALNLLVAGKWRVPVFGDLMSAVFDFLTLYVMFWAAGYHLSPLPAIAGYGLPNLAGKLSIFPGGVGVIEGGMAGLYLTLGVPGDVVVVVVLGYRLLSFWIPVVMGFPLAAILDRKTILAAP